MNGNGELPGALRMTMVFIDRVGFPILAFLLMFIYAFYSLGKMTDTLSALITTINEKSTLATSEHREIVDAIRQLDRRR